jgi:hypothetical protein
MSDQVPHPCSTSGKIIVVCILSLFFGYQNGTRCLRKVENSVQYKSFGEADPNPDIILPGITDILSVYCFVAVGCVPVVTLVCIRQAFDELTCTQQRGTYSNSSTKGHLSFGKLHRGL